MKDAQNLNSEAKALRGTMTSVQSEIEKVQKDTGDCMSNLERLDSLKSKLQVAKVGLQESDGWGRLTSQLEDLLEKSDLMLACDKLGSLQNSLAAQRGLAGQSERENQIEGFKNRLEALASPNVVQSLTTGDVEQSKKFVVIFTNMERCPQLTQYYRTVQKSLLQRHWSEITELSENSGSTRFLREFYEILIEHWAKQVKWCVQVFGPTGAQEPTWVISELLGILQPTRESVVLNTLKSASNKLDILSETSNANIYFGQIMSRNLKAGIEDVSSNLLKALSSSIFEYFNVFVGQYGAIEHNNLSSNISGLNLSHSTAAESIRALGNGNGRLFQWAGEALKRCDEITQNCALSALATILNGCFKGFLEKYKKSQNQLNASKTTEENWNLLQICISLLTYIGDFKTNLDDFELKFSDSVLEKMEKIESQTDEDFCYKITGKRELNEFKKLVRIVKEQRSTIPESGNSGIFGSVKDQIKPICDEIHDTTLTSVFIPIENHLKNIEPSDDDQDLPEFSYAPREYITQIGQYLLTLPQHLEPLLLSPVPSLKIALEVCDQRYTENVPSADILLSLIAEECCALYQEQISDIRSIKTSGAKQLATDVEYLGSVLEELGLSLGSYLQEMIVLLRALPENYLALSAGCDPKLVTAVRQMRNIISME